MEVVLAFALGLIAGVGLHWFLHQRHVSEEDARREAQHAAQLRALQDEVRQADSAHAETKQKLIELELARAHGQDGAGAAAARAAPPPPPASPDDLTRVRGIGKVMEKKLHELGIRNLHQLAELGPADIHRINAAIDFPGRVEREQWVEQARTMVAAG